LIVGEFEFEIYDENDKFKKAEVRKGHEVFYIDIEEIYQLEFIIKELKRRLKLKR
jgi:hypothetical protein